MKLFKIITGRTFWNSNKCQWSFGQYSASSQNSLPVGITFYLLLSINQFVGLYTFLLNVQRQFQEIIIGVNRRPAGVLDISVKLFEKIITHNQLHISVSETDIRACLRSNKESILNRYRLMRVMCIPLKNPTRDAETYRARNNVFNWMYNIGFEYVPSAQRDHIIG